MESKQQRRKFTMKKRNNRRGNNRRRRDQSSPGEASGSILSAGVVIKNRPLFGYQTRRTLTYYTTGTITSGASLAGAYVFAANGLYDPDISGSGGQPMGFDQAMLFYNHYTVHKCRARVVMMTNSTNLRVTVGLAVSGSSTATTSIETLVENGDIQFHVLEYAGAFGGNVEMRRTIDVGRFQAVRQVMDDPNMRGDSASNPTELTYLHLVVWNSASSTVVTADFQIILEFDATFHEPRKATLS